MREGNAPLVTCRVQLDGPLVLFLDHPGRLQMPHDGARDDLDARLGGQIDDLEVDHVDARRIVVLRGEARPAPVRVQAE